MKNLLIACFIIAAFASCKKTNTQTDTNATLSTAVHKVLILGNSITYAPANPLIGWNGSWGMAASVADNDYVHLLTNQIKVLNKDNTVTTVNIAQFENSFDTYDLDLNLKQYRNANPDIVILRIGENVTRTADSVLFEKKYTALLSYFKTSNTQVKILAVGPVWPLRDMANKVMSKYSGYIPLISLQDDQTNFAFGLYPDPGVQSHPSDKGMKAISNQIWVALKKIW